MDSVSKVTRRKQKIKKVSWTEIDELTERVAFWFVKRRIETRNIYPIPRGGYIVATILSHKLNRPIITKESQISKYTLIVDDIEDSGKTMKKANNKGWKVCLFSKLKLNKTNAYFSVKQINKNIWIKFPWEVE